MPPKKSVPAGLEKVCRQFMEGNCKFPRCRFIHDAELCPAFYRGGCTDTAKCGKSHELTAAAAPPAAKAESKPRKDKKGDAKADKTEDGKDEKKDEKKPETDEYGAPAAKKSKGKKGKNTESFEPCHDACTMRVVVDIDAKKLSVPLQTRDVSLHPMIFQQKGDHDLYDRLTKELTSCTIAEKDLLKSWHGDSHWIANDQTGWKKQCPTFVEVCERMQKYFGMDVKATRFNWYKDASEWKPYHHDAAAVKADKVDTQNFTVAASFGATREAAFEEVESKKTVAFPCPNGSVYCFSRDTNVLWRHGILQVPPELQAQQEKQGRISIILWGWVDQAEVGVRPPLPAAAESSRPARGRGRGGRR